MRPQFALWHSLEQYDIQQSCNPCRRAAVIRKTASYKRNRRPSLRPSSLRRCAASLDRCKGGALPRTSRCVYSMLMVGSHHPPSFVGELARRAGESASAKKSEKGGPLSRRRLLPSRLGVEKPVSVSVVGICYHAHKSSTHKEAPQI